MPKQAVINAKDIEWLERSWSNCNVEYLIRKEPSNAIVPDDSETIKALSNLTGFDLPKEKAAFLEKYGHLTVPDFIIHVHPSGELSLRTKKAKEIFESFLVINIGGDHKQPMPWESAKQCALKAVDLLIGEAKFQAVDYWKAIRAIIAKM